MRIRTSAWIRGEANGGASGAGIEGCERSDLGDNMAALSNGSIGDMMAALKHLLSLSGPPRCRMDSRMTMSSETTSQETRARTRAKEE